MPQQSFSRVSAILALGVTASFLPPLAATADDEASTAALIAELRHSFTLNGKPIPPEIFRDFGDGDLADSGSIWVTVDVKAATGSNLYFDDIKRNGSWINQKKATSNEETGYTHILARPRTACSSCSPHSAAGAQVTSSFYISST
jgi:hypothetical protein